MESNQKSSAIEVLKQRFDKKLFVYLGLRIGFVSLLVIGITVFITINSIKAHSDSDVEYKQESLLVNDQTVGTASSNSDINPNPPEIEENFILQPVSMSYEVDKVTPTPTPVIDTTSDDIWLKLAQCESRQNWRIDTGNGYYGGLQFSLGAWASVGGQGKPSDASAEEQIAKGKLLQQRRGWGAWGLCAKKLNLL